MKKYLLLATVAGCLLGANAMAEDSATVTAKVNIKYGCTLESPNDMDFGEIILAPNSSDIEFTMAEDGDITHSDSAYVLKYLQHQSSGAASVTINCGPGGENDAEGEADLAFDYENAGVLENDYLVISDASMVEVLGEEDEGDPDTINAGSSTQINFAGSKTYKIPAKLTVKSGVAPGEYEGEVLRVTLSY